MKTKIYLMTLFATTLYMMCGCGDSRVLAMEPIATDSVCVNKLSEHVECRFVADYPTADDSTSLAIRKYLGDELARLYLPRVNNPEEAGCYPVYKGNVNTGDSVLNYYADGTTKYLKEQLADFMDAAPSEMPTLAYDFSARKTSDNDRYVNYNINVYAFLGGAHGTTTDYTVTIVKPSGRVLTQTVDTLQVKNLQPILRKGVLSYLHEQGETDATEATLGDMLFVENGIIPLPVHAPYLTDDAVCFVYQQYEIASYAMGIVTFTVPYDQIKTYLTEEARSLGHCDL